MKTIMGVDVNDGDRVQFKYRKFWGGSLEKTGYFYEAKNDSEFDLRFEKMEKMGFWRRFRNWMSVEVFRYNKVMEIRVIPEAKDGEN